MKHIFSFFLLTAVAIVSTAQNSDISGCAAGMLAFTDQNPNVTLNEVLVLADEISGGTPNYFYSRRLPEAPNNVIESMNKLYARDDIQLEYFGDKGVGGIIPQSVYTLLPDQTFRTEQFYRDNLHWDFDNLWQISGNGYPTFRSAVSTAIDHPVQAPAPASHTYNLMGQKVTGSTLRPGIFIVGGKKTIRQ